MSNYEKRSPPGLAFVRCSAGLNQPSWLMLQEMILHGIQPFDPVYHEFSFQASSVNNPSIIFHREGYPTFRFVQLLLSVCGTLHAISSFEHCDSSATSLDLAWPMHSQLSFQSHLTLTSCSPGAFFEHSIGCWCVWITFEVHSVWKHYELNSWWNSKAYQARNKVFLQRHNNILLLRLLIAISTHSVVHICKEVMIYSCA